MFAEDLVVGASFDVGSWDVTLEEIVEFARRWDPLPMHVDIESAATTPFGEIIASGLHTMAIMQRLNVDGFYSKVAIIAGRSLSNLRLVKPVRPGTRLWGPQVIDAVTRRPSGRALVTTTSTLVDQADALVLSMTGEAVVVQRSTYTEGPPRSSSDGAD
ncbi:MaoC/PaaZ C-terminal domain-containing protein [Mycolicibacterium sp. CH28]|uniref:MaoC/PaaZ C-terminal domain-containing protein n=1 Tax=Mycolicibacterium sp. CH28 TaxID=2512237 RepID=UPI0013871CBD|nr:MaoC/PaaZ C-terminal domain-containing protein [Mycolicibacterium sp. CH28]